MVDRDLRRALLIVAVLLAGVAGGVWWLLREPSPPTGPAEPLEDPPEVAQALARERLRRRPPRPAPAPRPPVRLRPLPAGARVETLEQARKLPPESFDLGLAALLLARRTNPRLDLEAGLRQLDGMARAVLARLPARTSPRETAQALSSYLFETSGFRYREGGPAAGDPLNAYLDRVLERRQGFCLTLSLLYLALGERIGLPLVIVELPEHVFVRYEHPQGYFNIETTASGKNLSDDEYRKRRPFPKEAADYYLKSRSPRACVAYLLLSHALIEWDAGRVEPARAALREGLLWDQGNLYLTYNLANAELRLERWTEAGKLYRAFLARRPDQAIGWLGLARAEIRAGRLAQGNAALARAAALDPRNREVRLVQAELAFRREQWQQVHALLDGLPASVETRFLRARAYVRCDQHARALPLLQQLVALRPQERLFRTQLARCLARLGRREEAAPLLRALLAELPGDVYALATLGTFAYQDRRHAEAAKLFERALAAAPDREVLYNNLATCLVETGQAERATSIAARGLRRFPKSKRLARLAGMTCLNHLKDPARARGYFEHYRRLGGDDPAILRWLAGSK